jgi:hypothetical protein
MQTNQLHRAGSLPNAHGQRHDLLLSRFGLLELAGISPSCITRMRSHIFSTSGSSEEIIKNRNALRHKLPHQLINLGFGPDIDASCGLVEDQMRL